MHGRPFAYANQVTIDPSQVPLVTNAGGTQLSFWYRCGPKGHKWRLKEWVGAKNRGLKNWFFFEKIGLKELNFGHIWGFETEILRKVKLLNGKFCQICYFCWKGSLKELKHADYWESVKGGLKGRTSFSRWVCKWFSRWVPSPPPPGQMIQ